MAATYTHGTMNELLEVVFSVRSVPRLYNEGQLPLESHVTAVRRVGGWCEMAASLRGRESVSKGTSTGEEDTADREDLVRSLVNCRV
jgi:hypothetical protein